MDFIKALVYIILILLGILLAGLAFMMCLISPPSQWLLPAPEGIARHYEANADKIQALYGYINDIVPEGGAVSIEFSGNKFEYFHARSKDDARNVLPEDASVDIRLQKLGWTEDTLKELRARLDEAGCISISSGKVVEIGYTRSGFAKYSYILHSDKLDDEQIQRLYCYEVFYKDNVVFSYGSGAIGGYCFPEHVRESIPPQ